MENNLPRHLEKEFSDQELKVFSKMPEAAFIKLKQVIKNINNMDKNELTQKLECFHLVTQGDVECLRQRLKDSYKKIIPASIDLGLHFELLPYYVIIDFEATCGKSNPRSFKHEIIEFPAVIVNSRTQQITDCFQMYCKPQLNPKISAFCTELTGITQEQVDSAETFDKVLQHFQNWLVKNNLGKKHEYVIVTDSPWDMSRFLYSQCHYSNVKFPHWGTKWVNLRKAFSKFYHSERVCLKSMLEFLDMKFIGRPHCGLDDAKNIARVLLRMIYDGANIQINERITSPRKPQEKKKSCSEKEEHNENELDTKMKKLRVWRKIYYKYFEELNTLEEHKMLLISPEGSAMFFPGLTQNHFTRAQCLAKEFFTFSLKIEARYASVYSTNNVPVYKTSRRYRLKAEVQIARKILSNYNSDGYQYSST